MGPEQIDELFGQTLTGDYGDESPWAAVRLARKLPGLTASPLWNSH
jgi:hypothetical protein